MKFGITVIHPQIPGTHQLIFNDQDGSLTTQYEVHFVIRKEGEEKSKSQFIGMVSKDDIKRLAKAT